MAMPCKYDHKLGRGLGEFCHDNASQSFHSLALTWNNHHPYSWHFIPWWWNHLTNVGAAIKSPILLYFWSSATFWSSHSQINATHTMHTTQTKKQTNATIKQKIQPCKTAFFDLVETQINQQWQSYCEDFSSVFVYFSNTVVVGLSLGASY